MGRVVPSMSVLAPASFAGAGPNYQENGSFENAWSLPAGMPSFGWSTAPARDLTNGRSDGKSLSGSVTGPNVQGAVGLGDVALIPAAGPVTVSGFMRNKAGGGSPTGQLFFLGRRAATAVGSFDYTHGSGFQAMNDDGRWVFFRVTFALAGDEVAGYLRADLVSNGLVGGGFVSTFQVEDLQIEYGSFPSPFKPSHRLANAWVDPIPPVVFPVQIPPGAIVLWSGTIATIPAGWLLCDGTNGTPNLIDRFIIGAGPTIPPGGVGGTVTPRLALPTHASSGTHFHNNPSNNSGAPLQAATIQSGTGPVQIEPSNHTHNTGVFVTDGQGAHAHDAHALAQWYVLAYIMKS